ncbi:MAG: N-acetylmuramoyl-L-alanine amidase, partial [Streptosporangiaceae bacterium]|nr:N-acetylmuramoyl-L-alanine amidase [Streptosporangiaceae bacterium]
GLAPARGNRDQTVFLDAGHGGVDPGGTGTTQAGAVISEAQVDLHIELDAAALLRSRGYRIVVSRARHTTVIRLTRAMISGGLLTATGVRDDVAARDQCANMAGASILIGIYMNAGPGGAGCVTDYDASRPFSAGNRMLATLLQRDVLAAMNARGWGIPDGGVQPDTGMGSAITAADQAYGHLILLGPAKAGYFTTPSRMPGALIEPLFVTDPFEASLAASAQGQHVIAMGIAEAVDQYFASIGKRAA